MDLISVIIPVYNVEKYLDRCLKTVMNQTYTNLEIILVDDGSTDKSGKICDEYKEKDKRIKVIHKANGGLSSARNVGMNAAQGIYIGFVDSDDWIAKDMYEKLYNLMQSNQYDISICGIMRVTEDSPDTVKVKPQAQIIRTYTSDDYLKKILKVHTQDSNHYACNKLYKKCILKDMQYPEGLIFEDVEGTFLAAIAANKIIETNEIGYFYYTNNQSITMDSFSEKQFDYFTICDRIIDITQKKCSQEIQQHALTFRNRANFGILCKMAMSSNQIVSRFEVQRRVILNNLRKNYISLMKASLPLNRKLLISVLCINYSIFRRTMQIGLHMFKKKMLIRL